MGDYEIVFFDLETTGLSQDDEIIQIAACCDDSSFNAYITPRRPIHYRASEITGLQLVNNKLLLNGNRVYSTTARVAFRRFMGYLRHFHSRIILVAHNCFGFDMPRIMDLARKLGFLKQFTNIVDGFSDSLVILRDVLGNERGGKGSFTLKALVRDYLDEPLDELHNASRDAELLEELFFNSAIDPIDVDVIIQSSKSV